MPTVDPLEAEYAQFRKNTSDSGDSSVATVDPLEAEYSQFRKSDSLSEAHLGVTTADPLELEYDRFKKSDTPESDKAVEYFDEDAESNSLSSLLNEPILPAEALPPYWLAKAAEAVLPESTATKIYTGELKAVADVLSSFTSPQNVALLPLAGLGKVATRLVGGVFSGQAALHAPEAWKQFNETDDPEQKTRIAVGTIAGIGLPLLAFKGDGVVGKAVGDAISEESETGTTVSVGKPVEGLRPEEATSARPAQETQPQEAYRAVEGTTEGVQGGEAPTPQGVAPEQTGGTVRLYHGGAGKVAGADFTTSLQYASDYAAKTPNGKVWFVDVPEGVLKTRNEYGEPMSRVVVPDEIANQARPILEVSQAPVESVSSAEPVGVTETIAELQKRNAPDDKFAQYREAPTERSAEPTEPLPPVETGTTVSVEPVKSPTSIKNEIVDQERVSRGLPPAMEEASRDFGTVWDQATKSVDSDPMLPIRLTEELKDNPRAVTDTENAVLLQRQIDLQNQFDKAGNDLVIANGAGDIARAAEIDSQLGRISDELVTLYDINKSVGRETGRGLNARKMLANEDFSLSRMITKRRAARGGEPLTSSETAEVRQQSEKISDLQSKIDQQELKTHFDELIAASTAEAKQAKAAKRGIGDFLEEQANKARERIKARGGRLTTGIDPIDLADHVIIGADYFAKGFTKVGDWSAQMIKTFGETVKPFLKDLYAKAKAFHAANAKVFTSDDRRLASAKTRTTKRIEDLQSRIQTGNFDKPKRTELIPDKELNQMRADLELVKRQYNRALEKDKFKRMTVFQKSKRITANTYDAARLLMTTGEFSFILRQGKWNALSHPFRTAKAIPSAIKAMRNERTALRIEQDIFNDPDYQFAKRDKLAITEDGAPLSRQEELIMGRWGNEIPIVAHFNRAARVFLNKIRFDTYKAMRRTAEGGNPSPETSRAMAMYVNESTGRGGLGTLEPAAVALSRSMFSPRYWASRIQLAVAHSMWSGTKASRVAIAKEYARGLIGLGIYYSLLKGYFDKDDRPAVIGTDTNSADFGKIRLGNTTLDPLTGIAQNTTFVSRSVTGETTTAKGDVKPIRGNKIPYEGDDWRDIAGRYAWSKAHPVPGSIANLLSGRDLIGNVTTASGEAIKLSSPITYIDVYQALKEENLDDATALALLAFLGEGLQTRQPKPAPYKKSSKKTPLRSTAN